MVRRLTTNQEIACSNPAVVTDYIFAIFFYVFDAILTNDFPRIQDAKLMQPSGWHDGYYRSLVIYEAA